MGFGLLLTLTGATSPLSAQIQLNEIVAAPNDRLTLVDDRGRVRPGSGFFWADPEFIAPGWLIGPAPLGFGGAPGLGTNVAALMQNRTPNLYLRRVLTLTPEQVANEGQLQLKVRFDDGFIAYLNGREIARANAGPAGHYLFADQTAYNFAATTTNYAYTPFLQTGTAPTASSTGITYSLGKISDFLQPGDNILALQLINREPDVSARIDAQLEVVSADLTTDLARYTFNEANNSAVIHRNLTGNTNDTIEGIIPPNSWLALAAPAQSSPSWTDLALRSSLLTGIGYEATGALRYTHSQTDPTNSPARFFGPALLFSPTIAPGSLTSELLANLKLSFRFRATSNSAYTLRLDPDGKSPANSLTGLTPITAPTPSASSQAPDLDFANSIGGRRTRIVSNTGSSTVSTSGTLRNRAVLLFGSAMRSATFTLSEETLAGAGGSAGFLQFEVVSAPIVSDFFGFSYEPLNIRSWIASDVTPAQLKAGAIQFDYQLPAGINYSVYLEAALGSPVATDRLSLGTITGNGGWTTATLDTGTSGNQTAFLNSLNAASTNAVRVLFLCQQNLPNGSRLLIDNLGYFPWRTYQFSLSSGTNQAAFLAALNAQPSPQCIPVFEKNGTALAPANASVTLDDFALTFTKLNAGSPITFLPYGATAWSYFPGLAEPSGGVIEPADFTLPNGTSTYADWIELLNTSPNTVDLSNWSLSDSPSNPSKYVFPPNSSLSAGATLVVVADDRAAPAGASWRHAPFSLSAEGEYLGLYNHSGILVDALKPGYPAQNSFHSWGRDPITNQWGYLRLATPGQPNLGPAQAVPAASPIFSLPGGFYPNAVSITLTTSLLNGMIRYTLDGSEPTASTGFPYIAPLNLGFISDRIGHVIRARTFSPGQLPSPPITNTYLINQNAALRSAPATLLSGDPGTVFYKPTGLLAIQGGSYITQEPNKPTNPDVGVWSAQQPSDYNIPVGDGRFSDANSGSRPYERPSYLEYYYPDNRLGLRENIGLRLSASPYSRPRLTLRDAPNRTLWDADSTLKPSFNVFFRNDYGNSSINYPLIPETEVREFSEFRLRAGKNDISNPFIRDEFIRRLWTDMGHVGTVGTFTSVYLNGYFKGYYNLVERIREAFLQTHHRSTAAWDVNYIGTFEDGDNIHWNTLLKPRQMADLTIKANYDALKQVLDLNNVADYYLLNIYSAMWDWPHNNWAMARERSPTGLWRCYVWDAEGCFGLYGNKPPSYQSLNLDLLTDSAGNNRSPLPVLFRSLMNSSEFRLLFADRIQRHFFNAGVLTDAHMIARRATCQAEVAPLMSIANITPDTSWFNTWTAPTTGRRFYLFPNPAASSLPVRHGMFRDPNQDGNLADTLWPLTLPPTFNQHGGSVAAGFSLSLSHAAPPSSVIYYTTDGTDPRNYGGTVAAAALIYSVPILLTGSSITVKTRVKNGVTNEWSPLSEARFSQATVPASAANTVISEIMYNPPGLTTAETAAGYLDKQDFEYIVLQNIGPSPIDLTGLRFQLGITFNFNLTSRPILDPGQRTLIAKNASALRLRYGPGIDSLLGGEYFGTLRSNGELLRLETTATGTPIKTLTYSDQAPWPTRADGHGSALLLVNSTSNPDPDLHASWTATAALGGTVIPLNLSYPQWTAWAFPLTQQVDPTRSGPTADPDGDGLPNLIEFLTGTDPLSPATPPPLTTTCLPSSHGDRILRLTFPRLATSTGYQLTVQTSSDLLTWQNDSTLTASTPSADGTTLQIWEKTSPASAFLQFIRLKATPLP